MTMQHVYEVDHNKVTVERGAAVACTCGGDKNKPCEHFAPAVQEYRRSTATLNGNRGFSLMR